MGSDVQTQLLDSIQQTKRSFHRLVLLFGPTGTKKTAILRQLADSQSCSLLNVNLHLSQRMLELSRSRRARQADRIFNGLVDENSGEMLVLDNLEVLFDPSLQLDPLRLLKAVSRRQSVVAAWSGTFHDGILCYAEPDHPEYRSYRDVGALVVAIPDENIAEN